MGQVDPNIFEIPHKEAYITEDPQRRSPSPESPRPLPIIDEGVTTQEHQVVDVSKSRASGAGTSTRDVRMEERPQDAIQTKK